MEATGWLGLKYYYLAIKKTYLSSLHNTEHEKIVSQSLYWERLQSQKHTITRALPFDYSPASTFLRRAIHQMACPKLLPDYSNHSVLQLIIDLLKVTTSSAVALPWFSHAVKAHGAHALTRQTLTRCVLSVCELVYMCVCVCVCVCAHVSIYTHTRRGQNVKTSISQCNHRPIMHPTAIITVYSKLQK